MRDDPELTGAQSVIRSPAGQIESAGLIIDTDTGLPRDIEELPTSESEPLALSGVACIYRAAAFVRVRGFDPLYSNGFEDADLALRLDAAADRAPRFAVAPESRVTHFSVFSPGRFAQESANQRIFRARWDSVLQG